MSEKRTPPWLLSDEIPWVRDDFEFTNPIIDDQKVEEGLRKLRTLDEPPVQAFGGVKFIVGSGLSVRNIRVGSADNPSRVHFAASDMVTGTKVMESLLNGKPIAAAQKAVKEGDLAAFRRELLLVKDRVRATQTTRTAFRWISVLLPKRICDEEIGDALEDIGRIISDPSCPNIRRAVRCKIISTWFWLFWHAFGRISAAILGKKAG